MNNSVEIGENRNLYTIKDLTDIFITCSSPFTICFNCLVLFIAARYVNFKKRLEQWFVVNIASADLLFGLIYSTTVRISYQIPLFLCRPYYILIWISSVGSVVFLLLLNIHKLVTLTLPFHSLICLTKRKILTEIVLCWIFICTVSIGFSIDPLFRLEYDEYQCRPFIEPNYYSIRLAIFYIMPSALSLMMSICIFVVAQKNSRQSKNWMKRIIFVFSATVWMALTGLPYRVSYLITQLCILINTDKDQSGLLLGNFTDFENTTGEYYDPGYSKPSCFHEPLQYSLIYLLTLGSVINPLITIFTQQKYRQGIVIIWKTMVRRDGYLSPTKSRITSFSRTLYGYSNPCNNNNNYNNNNNSHNNSLRRTCI